MPFYPVAASLRHERVDQGVDFGGSGPCYAVEAGTIVNLATPGWPGGTMIVLLLDAPRDDRHRAVYYAEDLTPIVNYGQHVDGGQQIATAYGGSSGIEIGWASVAVIGNTLASDSGPYGGQGATAEGSDFDGWISNAQQVGPIGPQGPVGSGGPPGGLPVEQAWENYRQWCNTDYGNYLVGASWIQAAIDQF